MNLKVGEPRIIELFRAIFFGDQRRDLVIDTAAEKLVVAEVGEENVDGGGPAVRRNQVLQVNGLIGQLILEFRQGRMRRIDIRDEEGGLLCHAGDDVLDVGEAEDALHLGDLADLFGEALDLLQYRWGVDVVGDHADHPDLIAAEQVANLVVVPLFRIVLRQQAIDRAIQVDMPRVGGKKAREHQDQDKEKLGPMDDQGIDPLHNWVYS